MAVPAAAAANREPRSGVAGFGLLDWGLAAGLAAAVVMLDRHVLALWWSHDDLFQLRFVSRHPWTAYFLDPSAWGELPNRLWTPLLFASLDLDLELAGGLVTASPYGFYCHQLAALGFLAAALFGLLRLWVAREPALVAAVVAVCGPPVAALAPQLMVRHYLEGGLLAVGATICFVRAVRLGSSAASWGWTGASAVLALAAAAAKEVFVPLPLILALLPEGEGRRRRRLLLPHLVALFGYVAGRRYLLGVWLGGYGFEVDRADWLGLALRLPWRLVDVATATAPWLAGGLLAAMAAATVMAAWLVPKTRSLLAVSVAVLLLPLLPVASAVEPRFAAVPWVVLAIAGGVALGRFWPQLGAMRIPVLAGSIALASLAHAAAWAAILAPAERISAEGRAYLALEAGDLLATPADAPAALGELRRYVEEVERRPAAGWFEDPIYVCRGRDAGRRIWQYDRQAGAVREAGAQVRTAAADHCRRLRAAPLSARFSWHERTLRWELGPDRPGRWTLLVDDGVEAFPVPARGGYVLAAARSFAMTVRFDAAEGWTAYSEPITVVPGQNAEWSR
jgi:hypothetical protein